MRSVPAGIFDKLSFILGGRVNQDKTGPVFAGTLGKRDAQCIGNEAKYKANKGHKLSDIDG